MPFHTYDEVVADVARDLQLDEAELRAWFSKYLNGVSVPANWLGACYAVYRVTKLRGAFDMATRSRRRWRERAMELGSPGHLVR